MAREMEFVDWLDLTQLSFSGAGQMDQSLSTRQTDDHFFLGKMEWMLGLPEPTKTKIDELVTSSLPGSYAWVDRCSSLGPTTSSADPFWNLDHVAQINPFMCLFPTRILLDHLTP